MTTKTITVYIEKHNDHYDVNRCIHTEKELNEWQPEYFADIAHGQIPESEYDIMISRYGD